MDNYDKEHLREVNRLLKQIENLYSKTGNKVASIGSNVTQSGKDFNINTAKQYRNIIDTIFKDMQKGIEKGIVNGVKAQWEKGEEKAIDTVAKQLKGKLSNEALQKLKQDRFNATKAAYDAFTERMNKGLNLSERVWALSNDYKMNLEVLVNINAGKSAHDMAIEVQKFLKDPNRLFSQVKGADGQLALNLTGESGGVGRGVYRSSYKNALRLARTETNMAYRRAENARYQSLPFVSGFEVRLSNAHPVYDICDELKGKYPVDFIFAGWHPQCLCYTTSILNSDAEYNEMERAILNDEPLPENASKITDPPANFQKWVEQNMERSKGWKNQPYFIQDNFKGGTLDGGLKFGQLNTPKIILPITDEMKSLMTAIESITQSVNGNTELVKIPLQEFNNKLDLLKKEQLEKFKQLSSTDAFKEASLDVQNSLIQLMDSKHYTRMQRFESNLIAGRNEIIGELSKEEAFSIYRYTTGDYILINNALYGKEAITDAVIHWEKIINHSLEKINTNLPTGTIDLFRGTRVNIDEINHMISIKGKSNEFWSQKAFFSTSSKYSVANSFESKSVFDRKQTLFYIKSKEGANIRKLSNINVEDEFLFKTNKKWKVIDVVYDATDDRYNVWIEDF
jgi:hypothetical protein